MHFDIYIYICIYVCVCVYLFNIATCQKKFCIFSDSRNYLHNIYNFFLLIDLEQDSLSNEHGTSEITSRKSEDIGGYVQHASPSHLVISHNEDANKACCSSASSLFDFEIDRLKEIFLCCSPDILEEARERCCDFAEAVDFVMHQSNKLNEGIFLMF